MLSAPLALWLANPSNCRAKGLCFRLAGDLFPASRQYIEMVKGQKLQAQAFTFHRFDPDSNILRLLILFELLEIYLLRGYTHSLSCKYVAKYEHCSQVYGAACDSLAFPDASCRILVLLFALYICFVDLCTAMRDVLGDRHEDSRCGRSLQISQKVAHRESSSQPYIYQALA